MLEMADRRIVFGIGDDLFEGERAVTRAEFAAILVRGLGFSDVGTSDFPDVADSDWFAGAVGRAYELGLIYGRDDGNFDPNAAITREEAMAMITRSSVVAEYDGVDGETITGFDDVDDISAWAMSDVEYNISNNLIYGYDGLIRPTDTITRAETAAVILRLLRVADLVDVRS